MTRDELRAFIESEYIAGGYPRLYKNAKLILVKGSEKKIKICKDITAYIETGEKIFVFDDGIRLSELEFFNNVDLWRARGYTVEEA